MVRLSAGSLSLLVLLGSAAQADSNDVQTTKKKYNVLFLMCDSMDGRVLDPTSPIASELEMPWMWSLASQGVNFVNTYAASPQCSPSRTTMFTGRHIHEIKTWSNMKGIAATPGSGPNWELDKHCLKNFDEEVCLDFAKKQNVSETFVDTLTNAGVTVALYGKVDVGGNVIFRQDQKRFDPTTAGHSPDIATMGRAADIRKATKKRPLAKTNVPTEKIHAADWKITQECMDWFEKHPGEDANGPWLLYCSLLIPHPPYACNAETEAHVSKNIPLPKWFTTPKDFPESAMHPYDSYMSFSKDMMDEQGSWSSDVLEKNMRCWLAMCNQTDVMLGQVWAKAAETGNLDNTIVIFTSDHGEMHMEHRQHLKNSMFEGSSRVPLLIAAPGTRPAPATRADFTKGRLVKDMASLLDIYPTFADATGAPRPSFLKGFSLMPYLDGSGTRPEDYVISEYMSNMANTQAFMIRQDHYKYIAYGQYGPNWYKSYKPQLFDLTADPEEWHEVSGKYPDKAAQLDKLLRSVVNIDSVDREIKMEEKMLYDRYFKSKFTDEQLRKHWEKGYHGFDAKDWERVHTWYNSVESMEQPEAHVMVV